MTFLVHLDKITARECEAKRKEIGIQEGTTVFIIGVERKSMKRKLRLRGK